jgi:hypothetical protein
MSLFMSFKANSKRVGDRIVSASVIGVRRHGARGSGDGGRIAPLGPPVIHATSEEGCMVWEHVEGGDHL